MNDFEKWWHQEGSAPPLPGEDGEEHCKRMCQIAWSNGADKLLVELEYIANANTKDWDDPEDFKAWAQNRARFAIAKSKEIP